MPYGFADPPVVTEEIEGKQAGLVKPQKIEHVKIKEEHPDRQSCKGPEIESAERLVGTEGKSES